MSGESDYCPSDDEFHNKVNGGVTTAAKEPSATSAPNRKSTRRPTRTSSVTTPNNDVNSYIASSVWEREKDHCDKFNICPCTSFGVDRERRFPQYFFCGECAQWETDALACALSNKKSTSRQYNCTAKHEVGLLFPSHVQKYHHTLVQKGKAGSKDIDSFTAGAEDAEHNGNFSTKLPIGDYVTEEYDMSVEDVQKADVFPAGILHKRKRVSSELPDEDSYSESSLGFDYFGEATTSNSVDASYNDDDIKLQDGGDSTVSQKQQHNPHSCLLEEPSDLVVYNLQEKIGLLVGKLNSAKRKMWYHRSENKKLQQIIENIKKRQQFNDDSQIRGHSLPSPHTSTSKKLSMSSCLDMASDFNSNLCNFNTTNISSSFLNQSCEKIANILCNPNAIEGRLFQSIITCAKTRISDNNFSPQKILKAMDMRGGVLNYEGVDLLRQCKTRGRKNVHGTIIPSTASLQ